MLAIIVLLVIALAVYLVLYVFYPSPKNNDLLSTVTPLNQKKDVGMPDMIQQQVLGSNGTTVMMFVKLDAGDRTTKMVDQFTPVLQVANNWYIEISPAPMGKEHLSARLRITTNHTGTLKDEIVELPPIPKQKWMFIALLREGRRFDVIYQSRIVASHRLEHYPVVISSPLSVGNKGLAGSVIHVLINGKRLSPNEVERQRIAYVDTNGMVVEDHPINMSLPAIQLFGECPSGFPCDPVTKPPKNNTVEWSSPYA
jgi:hypothetical protein